ncbi:MAG: AfsR/SARP family transcriptional regulator, partial [Solirubrobacteraceae bacterium]
MEFRLLGPMDVLDGGTAVALGGLKQRALLARLLVTPNRAVAVDRLVDDLWGDAAPESAAKMVQIHVSQLRKLLPADVLLTRPPGYLVQVDPDAIDVVRFDRLRRTGRAALEAGEAAAAAARLRDALGLWRGEALAEFVEPFAQVERNHLDELRLVCLEDRV